MKSMLAILLGFAFVLSQHSAIWGAEKSDLGSLKGDARNKGVSMQKESEPPSAGAIFLNKNRIDHNSIEGKQSANFSPDFRRKDSVSKLVSQRESGASDSTPVSIYLTGIGFIFFVGLARRGVLHLFNS